MLTLYSCAFPLLSLSMILTLCAGPVELERDPAVAVAGHLSLGNLAIEPPCPSSPRPVSTTSIILLGCVHPVSPTTTYD